MRIGLEGGFSIVMLATLICSPVSRLEVQNERFGPQVKAFLELMRQEETELEFQIHNAEIPRKQYLRAKNRIAVLRETVLKLADDSGKDRVPELSAVVGSELDQILDNGLKDLRGVKVGAIIDGRWRYLGTVRHGEQFYVFERLARR